MPEERMLENEKFMKEHPDFNVSAMIRLFSHCQRRRAISLYEAYEHAYGKEGKGGCPDCRQGVEENQRLSRWET